MVMQHDVGDTVNIWGLQRSAKRMAESLRLEESRPRERQNTMKICRLREAKTRCKGQIKDLKSKRVKRVKS